jgi:hypothetical protein
MGTINEIITVHQVIDEEVAVSTDDGDMLYQQIDMLLKQGRKIEIDFSNISLMTTAFLNAAIGQLYKDHTSEFLNAHIKLTHVSSDDAVLFKKVIERAKEYFANKKNFEESANKAIYDA